MRRDSFIFYRSFYEAIYPLPKESQLQIYSAILEYGLNGTEPQEPDPITQSIFALIKPVVDFNNKQFANGKKGGRPPKQKPNQNPTETQNQPNQNPTETTFDNCSFLDEKTQKEKKEKKEIPPTPPINKKNNNKEKEEEDLTREREENSLPKKIQESYKEDARLQEIILSGIVDFYSSIGRNYVPDFRSETTAALELAEKLALVMKQENQPCDNKSTAAFWQKFLNAAWCVADQWQHEHFDIKTINSQFNSFIQKIKDGSNRKTAAGRRALSKSTSGFETDF